VNVKTVAFRRDLRIRCLRSTIRATVQKVQFSVNSRASFFFFGVTFHSDICDIPSHFYRGSRLHGGASAWSGSGRSWIGRRALGATNGAEGHLRRRSLKAVTDSAEGHHRRFLSLVSQRRGHVSHTHWWGTEIFVNHKGL
jgi:hypothetical protein